MGSEVGEVGGVSQTGASRSLLEVIDLQLLWPCTDSTSQYWLKHSAHISLFDSNFGSFESNQSMNGFAFTPSVAGRPRRRHAKTGSRMQTHSFRKPRTHGASGGPPPWGPAGSDGVCVVCLRLFDLDRKGVCQRPANGRAGMSTGPKNKQKTSTYFVFWAL